MIDKIAALILTLILFMMGSDLISQEFDGYALYTDNNTVFMIDKDENIAHRWNCDLRANYSMFLKENGNIVRGARDPNASINGPAVGGIVQELDPDANVVWEFTYSTNDRIAHHDICEMPDGGVLMIAWEIPPLQDLQAMGYEGTSQKYPTHLIEVQQDGTGGKIVWEWHMMDHFIQDVDSTLANYGVIADNPQLMDINVEVPGNMGGGGPPGQGGGGDWFHVNGVDYDPVHDQIIFGSRFMRELYIIDHSTTSEEAAGHSGGNSGMGGDFLWRWGNASNYDVSGTEFISAAVHDAQFIENDGRLYGGEIQLFNNEGTNGASQVDVIALPRDGFLFTKEAGEPYGPSAVTYTHFCLANADGQSASARMPNGNLYVNLSRRYQYEVDPDENLVWRYNDAASKGFRYACSHPGVQRLIADGYLDSGACMTSATEELLSNPFNASPNPSSGIFELTDFTDKVEAMTLVDGQGIVLQEYKGETTELDLGAYSNGVYFLQVVFENRVPVTKRLMVNKN